MSLLLQNIKLIGDNIPWLQDLRQKGSGAYTKAGIPTPKTEAWKYTKPSRFFVDDFVVKPQGAEKARQIKYDLPFDAYQICFENGVLQSIDSELPEGVVILPIIETIMFHHDYRTKIGTLVNLDYHPFAALNTACLNEGVCVEILPQAKLDKPIIFIYHTTADSEKVLYNMRNLIIVNSQAKAEMVEWFCYDGAPKSAYFNNIVNEIYLEDQAVLYHYKVQNEAFKAAHIALNSVKAAADSFYKSFCLQKGADLGRNETKVVLAARGASAQVDGAYMMNGWATLDTTTDIEHLVCHTTSNQLVKGVVGGQAKGVFQGKIHIAPNAVKTEGYQLHKALVLTDEAEVDVKPELEIFADDVKCSHGSACGQLDPEQLFYMRSRGISEAEAKQLLIDAYLEECLAKVDNEKIKAWIKSFLTTQTEISL